MASINRYSDGQYMGQATVDMDAYEAMAQQPEGLVEAGDVLGDEDMDRLGLDASTVIWCE